MLNPELERLALLAEEMGEALQAIGKIVRHGFESRNPLVPDSATNRELLSHELGDVICAIELMLRNGDAPRAVVESQAREKDRSVRRWMHYQHVYATGAVSGVAPSGGAA